MNIGLDLIQNEDEPSKKKTFTKEFGKLEHSEIQSDPVLKIFSVNHKSSFLFYIRF